MSGGEGFGPAGPVQAGGPPFAVAGPSTVSLDGSRTGTASFTVSNVTGRPVRARVLVLPDAGADASWFQVVGESERALPVAGTTTVDVSVKAAEKAPAGSFSFVVGVALEEAPDQVVSGPTVGFDVPEPSKRKFPWWIVIVAAVALLLLVGGGILIWNLTRPDPETSPPPSAPPTHAVFDTYDMVAFANLSFDVDGAQAVDYAVDFEIADILFFGDMRSDGFLGVVGYMNAGLAIVDDPTFEACESAQDYTIGESIPLPAESTTYLCLRYTEQGRMALLAIEPAVPASGTHRIEVVVWERD